MPTQRPFLSNFLAAFRAHQQLPKAAPSLSSPGASAQTIWTSAATTKSPTNTPDSTTSIVSPRPINPKTNAYNTQSSTTTLTTSADRQQMHHPLQHAVSPQTHLPRSPPSPGLPTYGPPNRPAGPSYPTPQETQPWSSARRARRGSDSSSDSGGGFREVRGPGSGEKWFVGGRTASGEEKYYALSKIRRDRSSDRISTDQLSL